MADVFISVEGIDGAGKSTLLTGTDDAQGALSRVKEAVDAPVYLSKEPGSVDDEEDGSSPRIYAEDHLMNPEFLIGAAHLQTDNPNIRAVLNLAHFIIHYDTFPEILFDAALGQDPWPGVFQEELSVLVQEQNETKELFDVAPSLRSKFDLPVRDLMRHILVHTGEPLHPEAAGLCFLASHLDHWDWMQTLPEDAVLISDRSRDSQIAYGRVNGAERTEWLYKVYGGWPDYTALVCCDPETAYKRTHSRDKDENKTKTGPEYSEKVQKEYLGIRDEDPSRFFVLDTTNGTIEQSTQNLTECLLDAIQNDPFNRINPVEHTLTTSECPL